MASEASDMSNGRSELIEYTSQQASKRELRAATTEWPVVASKRRATNRYVNIAAMPKLTVEGFDTVEVEEGKRLVLAIEQDAHVDVLHACGGNARCTTCRVEFVDGEPSTHTAAEKERLEARGLTGVRLSCQILCDHDMSLRAISRLEGSGRPDPGGPPADEITPPPVWV